MPVGIFSLVVAFVSGVAHSQEWTTWTRCTDSYCVKSRILQCTLDSNQAVGFECAKVGEAYFETLGNECTSACEEWSEGAGNSLCIGNCYGSKIEFQYICATQSQCLKRQMRRCYNHSTCLGRWTEVSRSSCSATCDVGVLTVHEECKIGKSYTSYNCPGSGGTSSSRQKTQSCYNCNDWEFWSDWTECNANCTRSRKRSCNADVRIGQCNDYSIVQNDVQNCSSCITNTLPITVSSGPTRPFLYLAIGVGGAVLLLLISVAAIVVVRRGKETKTCDEKRERVRITDITNRFSPTTGCSRIRRSFGSHYENLDINLHSTPGDIHRHRSSKQSLTATPSKATEETKKAGCQTSSALHDLSAPEYSMAADIQLPIGGYSAATDSEYFDEDASNDDVVESPEMNDALYATISEVKPVEDRKNSDKVEMKKKEKRRSKKNSENDKSFNVADQDRGFVAEDTPSYSEIFGRSNTIRAPQRSKDAIAPRWTSTRDKWEPKQVRSRTEIRRSPIELQRDRSTTTPALSVQNVEYSVAASQYTDMSGTVDVLKSVDYTDMTMKDGKFVTKTSHENVQKNFESYTDTSSKRIQIPDAYSMDPVSQ